MYEARKWENANDSVRYQKKIERDCVFVFLTGLNKAIDNVRGPILGKGFLRTIREVFSQGQREEGRQVMLQFFYDIKIERDEIALVIHSVDSEGDKRGGGQMTWCDYCSNFWRTRETVV
ncbi:hypothetical protein QQ045_012476 [Rhodiola kirilowii]